MNHLIKINPKTKDFTVFQTASAAAEALAEEMNIAVSTARCYISAALQGRQTFTDYVWVQAPSDLWQSMSGQIIDMAVMRHFFATLDWGSIPMEKLVSLKDQVMGLLPPAPEVAA